MAHPDIRFPRLLNVCFRIALLATLTALLLTPAAAQAVNTCTVISLDDSGTGTLRDHVADTNCDIIDVAPDILPGTIELDSQLIIDRRLTIQGPGADDLTISGGGTVRVFDIAMQSVDVAISGVTITGGSTPPGAFFPEDAGGGIRNAGNLTLTAVAISGNSAGNGAGIYSSGMLTLASSEISGNTARWGGGGIFSDDVIMTVTDSTILGNEATAAPAHPVLGGRGGGIFTRAITAVVTGSEVSGNSAEGTAGGGIFNGSISLLEVTDTRISGNSVSRQGGGIYNVGQLRVTGGSISSNNAPLGGGGIFADDAATTTLSDATISGNASDPGFGRGGGIENRGEVELTGRSLISDNSARFGGGISNRGIADVIGSIISGNNAVAGGGIHNDGGVLALNSGSAVLVNVARLPDPFSGLGVRGGGIYNSAAGTIEISESTFSGNQALSGSGGAVYSLNGRVTVVASIFDNNVASSTGAFQGGGGIFNESSGSLTVMNSDLVGNSASREGGGIRNAGTLFIASSTVDKNSAMFGGGISNASLIPATVMVSTISGNVANIAGGIYNARNLALMNSTVSDNSASRGGGIFNSGSGNLTVSNSTIADNEAGDIGGGIVNANEMAIITSTISGNSATNRGGGISNMSSSEFSPTAMTVSASTIYGNSAGSAGANIDGSGLSGGRVEMTAKNIIVAGGAPSGNCGSTGNSTFTSEGVNFADDASCPGFQQVADVMLGPLAGNGGLTMTHALLPGSPVINAVVDCTDVEDNPITEDQRGVERPQGAACDAGAFELEQEESTCEPPTIIALPGPREVPAAAGAQAEIPDLTAEVAFEGGCGEVTVTQDPAAGTLAGLGLTIVMITLADEEGNTTVGEVHITVTVGVAGLYPPLNASLVPLSETPALPTRAISPARGSLPLKLDMFAGTTQLTGPVVEALGLPAPVIVAVVDTGSSFVVADEATVDAPGESRTDNIFVWADDHWSYTLDTRALELQSGRLYAIQVLISDGTTWHATFVLR